MKFCVYKEKGKKAPEAWHRHFHNLSIKFSLSGIFLVFRIQFNSIHRRVILYWCQNLLNLIGGEWAEWCETEIKDENENDEKIKQNSIR